MEAEESEETAAGIPEDVEKSIEKRVKKILKRGNLMRLTEKIVRDEASAKLGMDLSLPPYKYLVRRLVEDFLIRLRNEVHLAKAPGQPHPH